MKTYERKTPGAISRQAEGAEKGVRSGLLATDGEASDAHILNIPGGEIPEGPPLLFGHDDFTGTSNLGSWRSFAKSSNGKKLGDGELRGEFGIELEGQGSQQAWREDVDHMIDKGHIQGLSIRWEHIDEPIRRINLPSDHIAAIDPKEATGMQEWGLYFEKWRMLEGSVVTLGADPAALIGRMEASEGGLRSIWRDVLSRNPEEIDGATLRQILDELQDIRSRLDTYDEGSTDWLRRIMRKDATLPELLQEFMSSETDDPSPAQVTEQGRAAQPDDEEADQQPPSTVTSETLQAALLKRQRGPAEVKRIFREELDKAQGRVS